MRIIPSVMHNKGKKWNAERKVFGLLEKVNLGPGWTAYHSLNVSEHAYKQWSELDFVIAGPGGLFILEVKGGRVAFNEGIWHFTDRGGVVHKKSEGPFEQAKTGMFALRAKISSQFGKNWESRLKGGFGVVFPDILFTQSSPEMPPEVVCDERCTRNVESFRKYLVQLMDYWAAKGKTIPLLDPGDSFLESLRNYLRPNFDVSPSLQNQIDNLHREIVQHTNEQYRYLDSLDVERILCSGGAGTGKSFLAIETARRELAAGKSVLLVAMSDIFVAYLRVQHEDPLLKVCSFSELLSSAENSLKDPYDVLIVDEGQDLLNFDAIDLLDKLLKNGIDNGRWRWFMDENCQAGIVGVCDIEALNMLKSTGALPMMLKYNCRNTTQIVDEVEDTTGAYIGITEIKGNGPKVMYCSVTDRDDEAVKLFGQLSFLLSNGIELSDMVILSPVARENSVVELLPVKWKRRLVTVDRINVMKTSNQNLQFSMISDFKGLERRYVLLVDLDVLNDSDQSIALLYVAMSRTHAGLWVAVGPTFGPVLKDLQIRTIKNKLNKGLIP